jgi:hypothetical protein
MTLAVLDHRRTGITSIRPVELTCFALCVAQAVYLLAAFVEGHWLLDADGALLASDFVNVWAAGKEAAAGEALAAFDLALHKEAEVAALGHSFDGYYPFAYPPIFLFPALVLARMPYLAAYAAWMIATFAAYAAVVRAIVPHRGAIALAFAYPGILATVVAGQNGFLTAALLGAAHLSLPRTRGMDARVKPAHDGSGLVAGCLFALLSFKPHFAVLIPLVLLATRQWAALAAAAVVTALLVIASAAAFGIETWVAFFDAVRSASRIALSEGHAGWGKLQSLFGVVRMLGGGEAFALLAQFILSAAAAVLLVRLWRTDVLFELKAAGLCCGVLLATPYVFLYDFVVLAIAIAFLIRLGERDRFLPGELPAIGAACAFILLFPVLTAPVGFAAAGLIALIVARRVFAHLVSGSENGHYRVPAPHGKN